MANKQKAWRTQAAAINKRRAEGSKEATARVQKFNTVKIVGGMPSSLWIGLMIRAGLYDPLPTFGGSGYAGENVQNIRRAKSKGWFSKAWNKAKSLFN